MTIQSKTTLPAHASACHSIRTYSSTERSSTILHPTSHIDPFFLRLNSKIIRSAIEHVPISSYVSLFTTLAPGLVSQKKTRETQIFLNKVVAPIVRNQDTLSLYQKSIDNPDLGMKAGGIETIKSLNEFHKTFMRIVFHLNKLNDETVRNFIKTLARSGSVPLFQIAIEGREHLIDTSVLEEAARSGSVSLFKLVIKGKEHLIDSSVLEEAAGSGSVPLFEFAINGRKHFIDSSLLHAAASSGNLSLFQFAITGREHLIDSRVLHAAVISGSIPLFRLAIDGREHLIDSRLIESTVYSENAELIALAVRNRESLIPPELRNIIEIMNEANESGVHLHEIMLKKTKIPINSHLLISNISNFYLFEFIISINELLINSDVLIAAARSGNFDVFELAINDRDHLINSEVLTAAAESGNFSIFARAVKDKKDLVKQDSMAFIPLINAAIRSKNLRIVDYILSTV